MLESYPSPLPLIGHAGDHGTGPMLAYLKLVAETDERLRFWQELLQGRVIQAWA